MCQDARFGHARVDSVATLIIRTCPISLIGMDRTFSSFGRMDFSEDNFEDAFTQAFATKTLVGRHVRLVGLTTHPISPELVFQLVRDSEDFLAEHLPWVRGTSAADIARRMRSWVFAEQYSQGGCWGIFAADTPVEERPEASALAGFIMLEVNLKNRSAIVSYWLSKKYTGRGLATESLNLLAKFAFEVLRLNRLELSASVRNEKSSAVALRAGFKEEGLCRDYELIDGKFVDHRRFSLLARDFT